MKLAGILRRLEGWKRGAPVPVGEKLPWSRAKAEDRLIVAFVRMAGESLPWGVAVGHPGEAPQIFTAAEPRDRDQIAGLTRSLGDALLAHLPHPEHVTLDPSRALDEIAEIARRRQIWLAGPTHVEMLHFLDFRFSLPRASDTADDRRLAAIGRAAGWLFRESSREGQTRVFDATRRLAECFSFPAEDVRQAHLGFLMAWLRTEGDRDARVAAARVAEASSVGVTMEVALEKERLEPLLERWRAARDDAPAAAAIAAEIHAVLAPELERRWRLTEAALALLDADPRGENPEMARLYDLAADEFTYQYWNNELKAAAPLDPNAQRFFGNHPESDFQPSHAAARYFAHVHAAELARSELVHGDRDRIEAAVDAGDAIRGRIVKVADEGQGRATAPVWTIEAPAEGALRLRTDTEVCVAGQRKRSGKIRSIVTDDGVRTVVVEISNGKTKRAIPGAPDANDARALEGTSVTVIAAGTVGISRNKSFHVWDDSGPGAWLTHSAPPPEPGPRAPIEADLVALVEGLGGR